MFASLDLLLLGLLLIDFLEGILADKVATLEVRRLRFARARPGFFEISSAHHVPSFEKLPKQVINVDNIYRAGVHKIKDYKADTVKIKADPKLVFIHHYRAAKGNAYGGEKVDFETYDFNDRSGQHYKMGRSRRRCQCWKQQLRKGSTSKRQW